MRIAASLAVTLMFAISFSADGKKPEHTWSIGKVLDQNRARYFAGMLNNSSSQTSNTGTWNGNANSTSLGDSTNTQINGSYSGSSNTSTSGMSVPVYRVFDNLVIEGADAVYITSERLRWRWSKGTHVAVNGAIKYYVDGRKLHVLDEDNKEHTIEIVKEIRKVPPVATPQNPTETERPTASAAQGVAAGTTQASVTIESTPTAADIEVDGGFVGNTPSTVNVLPGSHEITVKKKGYADWSRKLNVTGGSVHLSAELEQQPAQ